MCVCVYTYTHTHTYYIFFICLYIDRHLSQFHSLDILNSATNVDELLFTYIPLDVLSRTSRIEGYRSSIFRFLSTHQTAFSSDYTSHISISREYGFLSSSSTTPMSLVLFILLMATVLTLIEMKFTMVLIHIPLASKILNTFIGCLYFNF
jgi:hypothetical protein